MNKRALADAVAQDTGLDQATADAALSVAFDAIGAALAAGDKVAIPGFGTFEPRQRAARTGRNPRSGEPLEVPAAIVPAFKAATGLKRAVNGG